MTWPGAPMDQAVRSVHHLVDGLDVGTQEKHDVALRADLGRRLRRHAADLLESASEPRR
jgi:hypothetical protein